MFMKIKRKHKSWAKNEANAYIPFAISELGAEFALNRLESNRLGYSRLGHVSLKGEATG
jgi:hypothetical protein